LVVGRTEPIGLTLVGWGLIGHGFVVVRAMAIGIGVVIFLLGLALGGTLCTRRIERTIAVNIAVKGTPNK
jgi:hypothetical protein